MSAQEVKSEIIHAFHVEKFIVLELDNGGHNLVKCGDQKLDGQRVVDRNGALYLCQKFDQVSVILPVVSTLFTMVLPAPLSRVWYRLKMSLLAAQ